MFKKKGYTLFEVLIATVIFSAMIMLASLSLDQSLKYYTQIMRKGISLFEESKVLWLQKSLGSATDYYIFDKINKIWVPFFKGERDRIVYITLTPLFHDFPVLAILKREINNEGKEYLVYYELPVYTMQKDEIEKVLTFEEYKIKGHSLVIYTEINNVRFRYFVFNPEKLVFEWISDYEAKKFLSLPEMVQINFIKNDFLENIYISIQTNSKRKTVYNERI